MLILSRCSVALIKVCNRLRHNEAVRKLWWRKEKHDQSRKCFVFEIHVTFKNGFYLKVTIASDLRNIMEVRYVLVVVSRY